ncbi:hypothetical protein BDZ94DRAFT_1240657 [Collybia nuda]|uniref:Uncharacterized protein n=1 Tax=Collybia nuda TaxID=64659 RepID=A0A9P5XVJ7_9AGAR|nr:hypothetical protein BDZ94DRAFT_1240657 [Collybia nuda]
MFTKVFSTLFVIAATTAVVSAGGRLTLCTDVNMTGHCETISYLNNECINLGSALANEVSSVDPEGDGHKCYLFVNAACQGDHFDFTKHHDDIGVYEDRANSFYCNNAN